MAAVIHHHAPRPLLGLLHRSPHALGGRVDFQPAESLCRLADSPGEETVCHKTARILRPVGLDAKSGARRTLHKLETEGGLSVTFVSQNGCADTQFQQSGLV